MAAVEVEPADGAVPLDAVTLAESGAVSAFIAARYRRQATVPAAPAPASPAPTSPVQVRADRRADRGFWGLTCRAVDRRVAATFGAMVLTTASDTAGAMVDVVYLAAFSSRGAAQLRALSVLARRPAFMFAAADCMPSAAEWAAAWAAELTPAAATVTPC